MDTILKLNPIYRALFKLFLCSGVFTFCILFGENFSYIPFPLTIFATFIITVFFAYWVFEIVN